jgi:hypothetical protein
MGYRISPLVESLIAPHQSMDPNNVRSHQSDPTRVRNHRPFQKKTIDPIIGEGKIWLSPIIIWVNYNIWGWFPLLTMIIVRENSEVVIFFTQIYEWRRNLLTKFTRPVPWIGREAFSPLDGSPPNSWDLWMRTPRKIVGIWSMGQLLELLKLSKHRKSNYI